MYYFCFGTLSGLFVEGLEPAKMPEEISFFDLRRKRKRAIPYDDSINLIVRRSEAHLFIACSKNARDSKRDGFLAYGVSLIEPFTPEDIEKAIDWSYQELIGSEFIDDGKIIGSPSKSEGSLIDLSGLDTPADFEKFALVNYAWQDPRGKKEIAVEHIGFLCERLTSFEIVYNSRTGDHISILEKLAPSPIREQIQKTEAKVRQSSQKNQFKSIQSQKKKKSRLPLFMAWLAVFCVFTLGGLWTFRPSNDTKSAVESNTKSVTAKTAASEAQVKVEPINIELQTTECVETNVGLLSKSDPLVLVSQDLQLSNIPTGCPKLSEDVLEFFKTEFKSEELQQTIAFDDGVFNLNHYLESNNTIENKKIIYLTDFRNLTDWIGNNNPDNLLSNAHNFGNTYSFAIEKPASAAEAQIMFCDKDIVSRLEEKDFDTAFQLKYFTTSSGFFEKLVTRQSEAFQSFFIVEIRSNIHPDNEINIKNVKLTENWGKKVSKHTIELPIKDKCIFTFNDVDRAKLKNAHSENKYELFSVGQFLSKFEETKSDKTFRCSLFPQKILLWKSSPDQSAFEMDSFDTINFIRPKPLSRKKPLGKIWELPQMDIDIKTIDFLIKVLDEEGKFLKISETVGSSPCK